MDAIQVLKQQHDEVNELFAQFEKARTRKAAIAQQICEKLSIHDKIEREIFYPAVIENEEIKDQIRKQFIDHSKAMNSFFGFDLDVVRQSDAPGTSAPSPLGIRAGELITLVKYAASLANTRIVEFSEVNPNFDIDNRTTKLVAIAMHRFCSGVA